MDSLALAGKTILIAEDEPELLDLLTSMFEEMDMTVIPAGDGNQALVAQDMFLAGTIVLLLGVMTVIGTLISDLLLMWIEPRLRLQGRA